MCTAIANINDDIIYGFNLDIDPAVWNFSIRKTSDYFSVGITVGKTTYLTHGVTREGRFGNVPYMNGAVFPVPRGARRERIDLITDRYIRGRYSFDDIVRVTETKTVVSPPAATMHSLIGDGNGNILLIEPGYGVRRITDSHAVITNFPVLAELNDYSNRFYGKDRYDTAAAVLNERTAELSVDDAIGLLCDVRQDGKWGTKVSFVYSRNENAVHYFTDGDVTTMRIHRF